MPAIPQPDPTPESASTANLSGTTLREVEHRAIAQALQICGGNISRAARLLGMHRSTLHRRLRR